MYNTLIFLLYLNVNIYKTNNNFTSHKYEFCDGIQFLYLLFILFIHCIRRSESFENIFITYSFFEELLQNGTSTHISTQRYYFTIYISNTTLL